MLPGLLGLTLVVLMLAACGVPTATTTMVLATSATALTTTTSTAPITTTTTSPGPQTGGSEAIVDPRRYFPMEVGREWTYDIAVGSAEPMICEDVVVAKGGEPYNFSLVGSIHVSGEGTPSRLRMRVVAPAQEELRAGSVEVKVLEDDLGLFRFVQRILWHWENLSPPGGMGSMSGVAQSFLYSAPKLMSAYPYDVLRDAESVHSTRTIFIWNFGRIEQEDKEEVFSFLGVDSDVAGWRGIPCLHFVREATSDRSTGSVSLTEDCWYAPDEGLVRLEQRIAGKLSMTWTLASQGSNP